MDFDQRPKTRRPPTGMPPRSSLISSGSRPITQQGLTGVRPINTPSAGSNRFYKDKRYYQSLIQSHMKAIREEMAHLSKNTEECNLIASNTLSERRSMEIAAETYTEQQEMLGVYNTILEIQNSKARNEKLVSETNLLKEKNKHMLGELDILFSYKVQIEEKIQGLKNEIAAVERNFDLIVDSLSPDDKVKYVELLNETQKFAQKIEQLQSDIKEIRKANGQYEKNLENNPMKREMFLLLEELNQNHRKKSELIEQSENVSRPEQEREKLIVQLKSDKADIEDLGKMKEKLEEELGVKQEKLEHLETELNEKNTNRLKKHKELRERDAHMTKFIDGFGEKSSSVREKIAEMQSKISKALNHLADSITDLQFEEVDNIQSDFNQSPIEGLSNQYVTVTSRFNRLKGFKEKFQSEILALKKRKIELQNELRTIKNPDKIRDNLVEQKETAFEDLITLKTKLESTNSAVLEAERKRAELEETLNKNDKYHEIVEMEKKIAELEERNGEIREVLNATLQPEEIQGKLEEIRVLCARRNEVLIEALKNKSAKASVEYEESDNRAEILKID